MGYQKAKEHEGVRPFYRNKDEEPDISVRLPEICGSLRCARRDCRLGWWRSVRGRTRCVDRNRPGWRDRRCGTFAWC